MCFAFIEVKPQVLQKSRTCRQYLRFILRFIFPSLQLALREGFWS